MKGSKLETCCDIT